MKKVKIHMESVGHGTGVRVTYLADAQSRDAVRAGVNWIVLCNTYVHITR